MAKPKTNPPKKTAKPEDDEDREGQEDSEDSDSSDDDRDAAEAENRRINAIVTSRVKREMKSVLATLTQLQESVSKLAPAKKPEDGDGDDGETEDGEETKPKKKGEVDPAVSRKLTKLERELADERAARKQAEQDRTQEQERSKKAEMRAQFSAILTEHGVTDRNLLRSAISILEEDGVMTRDDDGKVRFKGQDKYGIETLFDPKIGLKAWLAGDGKSFVPAVDAGGSGTGPAQRATGQALTSKDLKGMSPQQLAAINLERACTGLPPLGEEGK